MVMLFLQTTKGHSTGCPINFSIKKRSELGLGLSCFKNYNKKSTLKILEYENTCVLYKASEALRCYPLLLWSRDRTASSQNVIDFIKNQYEIKMGPIYCFNTHSCLTIYQCTLFYRTKARTSFPYLLIMQSIQIKTIPYFWGKRIFCHYLLAVALSSSAECLIYFFFSIKIKPMRTGTVKL